MKFFKVFFASFLAVITAVIIGLPILFMIIGGIFASIGNSNEPVSVAPGTVLKMQLKGAIVENAQPEPFDFDFDRYLPVSGLAPSTSNLGLFQILESIEQAKNDPNVKGIYLNTNMGVSAGWASLQAIRTALLDFKAAGKFIYSYSEIYSETSYYLASVADKVYLPPEGMMELNGFGTSRMYYAGMFKKFDIKPQVFKVGTFKSAVEPYLREDMSDSARYQTEEFLGDLWQVFASEVATSRGTNAEKINMLAETFILGKGEKALKAGLIDEIAFDHEVEDAIKAELGIEPDEKAKFLSFKKYLKVPGKLTASRNKIAVVFADGTIQSGKSAEGVVGSASVVKALRKAREDNSVKAVVLRINSPGGSALASDMMAKEVSLTSEVKPIIASMGDVAASGGYYIAAQADRIFAQENTITGSIGIFGLFFNTDKLLGNNLGLTFDEVETHSSANLGDPNFPLSPAEQAFLQNNVEQGYSRFIEIVRSGRDFADSASVDKIAQGRVWSGMDAKEINLIDEFGNLQDAIAFAAEQAGIQDDYRIRRSPELKTPIEEMMAEMLKAHTAIVSPDHPLYSEYKRLLELKRAIPGSGTYMMLPYDIKVE